MLLTHLYFELRFEFNNFDKFLSVFLIYREDGYIVQS